MMRNPVEPRTVNAEATMGERSGNHVQKHNCVLDSFLKWDFMEEANPDRPANIKVL